MNNITTRSLSGSVYLILLIGCVLWCKYSFLAIMLIFTTVMTYEFLRMTMGEEYRFSQTLTIITSAFSFILVWAIRAFDAIKPEFVFLALIPIAGVMIQSLYVKDKSEFGKFANLFTSQLYIALPLSINNFLVMDPEGNYCGHLLICFFVLIWVSDIGAYLFGMSLGQKFGKKLFPSISPKKSWIGFWGGFVLTVASSLIMYFTGVWEYAGLEGFTWYHAVLLAVLMCITGVYGDLYESQWKRHYEVKDSGNILPGHGGLLDRLDSSIFAIPAGVLYLSIFNFISTI